MKEGSQETRAIIVSAPNKHLYPHTSHFTEAVPSRKRLDAWRADCSQELIIKVGFLGGNGSRHLPTMDGWAPWFPLKEENAPGELRRGQAGPLSVWSLCFEWLCPRWGAWGLSLRFESGFLLPVALKVNLSRSRTRPTAWDRPILKSLPRQVPPPWGNVGPHPSPASAGQTVAHITQTPQPNLGREGEWQVGGEHARKDVSVTSR